MSDIDLTALRRSIVEHIRQCAQGAGCRYVILDIDVASVEERGVHIDIALRTLTLEQVEGIQKHIIDLQDTN